MKKCRAHTCDKLTSGIEGYCVKHRELSLNRRYKQLKAAVKRKGEFDIKLSEYEDLLSDNSCHYCGNPLPPTGHGLDRVDSSKSYTLDNVVPCCTRCNRLKSDVYSYEQTKILVDFILEMEQNNWQRPRKG